MSSHLHGPRALALWAVLAMSLLPAFPAAAQWSAARPGDPVEVVAHPRGAGVEIRLEVQEGWYVYGTGAEEIGLPLRALPLDGEASLPLSTLDAAESIRFMGRVIPVHRGTVRLRLAGPSVESLEAVRLRWAACRGDLCVPRESVVPVRSGVDPAASDPSTLPRPPRES